MPHSTFRYTTEEVRLGDVVIPPYAQVIVSLAAANRDPARYRDAGVVRHPPHRRRPPRPRPRHPLLPRRTAGPDGGAHRLRPRCTPGSPRCASPSTRPSCTGATATGSCSAGSPSSPSSSDRLGGHTPRDGGDEEAGIDGLPAEAAVLRRQEQVTSAAIVGINDVTFLGRPDGVVLPGLDLRRDIVCEIRRTRPGIRITATAARTVRMPCSSQLLSRWKPVRVRRAAPGRGRRCRRGPGACARCRRCPVRRARRCPSSAARPPAAPRRRRPGPE